MVTMQMTKNERDFDGGKDGHNNFGRSMTYDGSFIVGGPDDDFDENIDRNSWDNAIGRLMRGKLS